MTAHDILKDLIRIRPDFRNHWDGENYFRSDDGSFTACGVFSQFTDFFREWHLQFKKEELEDMPEAFVLDYRKRLDELGEKYAVPLSYRVTAKGSVSHIGRYGHMGLCSRRFSVERIMSFERLPVRKGGKPNQPLQTTRALGPRV